MNRMKVCDFTNLPGVRQVSGALRTLLVTAAMASNSHFSSFLVNEGLRWDRYLTSSTTLHPGDVRRVPTLNVTIIFTVPAGLSLSSDPVLIDNALFARREWNSQSGRGQVISCSVFLCTRSTFKWERVPGVVWRPLAVAAWLCRLASTRIKEVTSTLYHTTMARHVFYWQIFGQAERAHSRCLYKMLITVRLFATGDLPTRFFSSPESSLRSL